MYESKRKHKSAMEERKKTLRRYLYIKNVEVPNQEERLMRLRSCQEMAPMGSGDGSQRSLLVEDKVSRQLAEKEKIENQIKRLYGEMRRIEYAVDSVEDSLERELLRLRYMDGEQTRHMPWSDICIKLYGDYNESTLKSVFRLHGIALQHVEM